VLDANLAGVVFEFREVRRWHSVKYSRNRAHPPQINTGEPDVVLPIGGIEKGQGVTIWDAHDATRERFRES